MPETYAGKTVGQRMALCRDLIEIHEDAQALTGVNAMAGKLILNTRAAAVRRLLGIHGDMPADPFDDLMNPRAARARLQSMVDELNSLEPARRLAQAERVRDIGRMLAALGGVQQRLGIRMLAPRLPEEADIQAQKAVMALQPPSDQASYSYQVYDAMREANMVRGGMTPELRAKAAEAHAALDQHRAKTVDAVSPELAATRDTISAHKKVVWDSLRAAQKEGNAETAQAAQEAYNKLFDQQIAVSEQLREAYNAETRRIQAELAAVGSEHMQRVMDASTVTPQQATAWADAQEITKTAAARLSKIKYPVAKVRQDMAEFYRLTGGRLNSVKIDSKGDRRANAVGVGEHGKEGVVFLDGDFDKRVLFHELSHHLESDPAIFKASANYIRANATSQEVQSLRSLTGSKAYDTREVALPGGFYSAYIGKVYRHSATEVMSMGIEAFAEPWKLGWVAGKDPKTIEFVSGALMAPQTDDERMHAKLRDMMTSINGDAKQLSENAVEEKWAELAAQVQTWPVTQEQAIAWFNENTYYGSTYRREIEKKKITPICMVIDGGDLGPRGIIVSEMVKNGRDNKRLKGFKLYYLSDRLGVALSREVGSKNLNAALSLVAIFTRDGYMPYFFNIDNIESIAEK